MDEATRLLRVCNAPHQDKPGGTEPEKEVRRGGREGGEEKGRASYLVTSASVALTSLASPD